MIDIDSMSLPLRESYAIKALMPFVISPLALTNYHTLGQLALFLIFPVQICFSASNRYIRSLSVVLSMQKLQYWPPAFHLSISAFICHCHLVICRFRIMLNDTTSRQQRHDRGQRNDLSMCTPRLGWKQYCLSKQENNGLW